MAAADAGASTRPVGRLLIDAHHVGQRQTGNETWVRNISRELARSDDSGALVWAASRTGAQAVATLTGREPHLLSASAIRRLALDLPRIARKVDASCVLVQYTMPLMPLMPVTRRPCVVVVHDLSPYDERARDWLPPLTARRIRQSIRHSARHAAELLVPSEFTRRQLLERFPRNPEQVTVAGNAVDPELAEALSQVLRMRSDSGVVVLAVGNVVPRKNLAVAARAVANLRAEGLDARLRVVGTVAPSGDADAAAMRSLLGSAVTMTGYVSVAQLAQEYADADLLVFPSLFEGFGIPALEAMAAGVPVLVSDRAALPEVVGDAGLVIDAEDVGAWTSALRGVCSDGVVRDGLVTRGLARAATYSWADSAAVTQAALHRAAGSQGRGAR